MSKKSTIHPVPGDVQNYNETIMDIIRHVDSESPVEDDLVEYLLESGLLGDEDDTRRQLIFLREADVLQQEVNQYQVGSKGYKLLDSHDEAAEIFQILDDTYIGFEALLRQIEYQGIIDLDNLNEDLRSELDVDWEDSQQTKWRLDFLRGLGYVETTEGENYEITSAGTSLIRRRGGIRQFEPPPSPQSLMIELREQSPVDYHFYWSQSPERLGEFTEYIRIPIEESALRPHSIGPKDIIFRYVDGKVVGYARLEEPGTTITEDGTELFRAKIYHREFDREVPLSDLLAELTAITVEDGESLDGIEKYPFNQSGLQDCILGDIPPRAALHILEQGNEYQTYADLDLEREIPTDGLLDANKINLYYPDEQLNRIYQEVKEAIVSGEHIIFVGPPGTGKSKLAKHIAESVCGPDGYAMVTATANWSTFDTVGGYQPDRESHLEFIPGTFLSRFQNKDGMPANEWLIIDEINRANIDKAFGSFFSALAGDTVATSFKSDNGEEITIIGDGDTSRQVKPTNYFVPESWRVLATMNTHDKMTLYDLSYAFMRRFAFVNIAAPDENEISPALLNDYVSVWSKIGLASSTQSDIQSESDDESNSGEGPPQDETDVLTLTESQIDAISLFWKTFQSHRSIGPAIVHNVATAVARQSSEDTDLTSPLKMYVLPQLGDLPEATQVDAINALLEHDSLPLDRDHLREFSAEYFGIDKEKLSK